MLIVKKCLLLLSLLMIVGSVSVVGFITQAQASDINTAKSKADRFEKDYKQFVKVSKNFEADKKEMMFKMQISIWYEKLSPNVKKLVIKELDNRGVKIPTINSNRSLAESLQIDGAKSDKKEAKSKAETLAGNYEIWKKTSQYLSAKDKKQSFDTQFTRQFDKLSPNMKKLVIQELNSKNVKIPTIN